MSDEPNLTQEAAAPESTPAVTLGDAPAAPAPVTKPSRKPGVEAGVAEIASGREVYASHCAGCHGKDGVGRYGGSVPDLRYATAETHATWHAIVIGGSRQASGMPRQDVSLEESEAVRGYLLSLSEALREGR